jgi:hypothetical protein
MKSLRISYRSLMREIQELVFRMRWWLWNSNSSKNLLWCKCLFKPNKLRSWSKRSLSHFPCLIINPLINLPKDLKESENDPCKCLLMRINSQWMSMSKAHIPYPKNNRLWWWPRKDKSDHDRKENDHRNQFRLRIPLRICLQGEVDHLIRKFKGKVRLALIWWTLWNGIHKRTESHLSLKLIDKCLHQEGKEPIPQQSPMLIQKWKLLWEIKVMQWQVC